MIESRRLSDFQIAERPSLWVCRVPGLKRLSGSEV